MALMVFSIVIGGCSHLVPADGPPASDHLPQRSEIHAVPFYPQEDHQCGPAALAMVLEWSGLRMPPGILREQVFTPAVKGSYQSAIIGAARRQGRIAYPVSNRQDLLDEVAAGHPAIVLQNLGFFWYPVWHYAVVIGYDLQQNVIFLHSGTFPRKQLTMSVFNATWGRSRNWGLLVLPPDRLPVTAELPLFLSAVIGLEQAGRWAAAIEGYDTALKHWPSSLAARIGLGNCWYALGNLTAAEKVLREASRRFPEEGGVFNNLAQVLFEQHKQQEALETARRAVQLGGPLVEVYRKTLEEIQAGHCAQGR
jgi:hypothetical protein